MSNAIVCIADSLPFYAQELSNELHVKRHALYDSTSGLDYPCIKPKPEEIIKIVALTQDENEYSHISNSSTDIQIKQKPSSRKREASNILIECVKRRDNLQNIDIFSSVPLVQDIYNENKFNYNLTKNTSEVSNLIFQMGKFENQTNDKINEDTLKDIDSSDNSLLDIPHKNFSTKLSYEIVFSTRISEKKPMNDFMDIDHMQTHLQNLNNSVGSSAIYEHLNCLHLNDEAANSKLPSQPLHDSIKYPFVQSHFKDVPPTIYFSLYGEIVEPLPEHILSLMKWKLSSITPILIREIVTKSGFQLLETNTSEDWIGTWGKHLKCATYKQIKNYQKVNHFPGSFHLGRKDKLWENYRRMRSKHGTQAFNFFPETFVLPTELKSLKKTWENEDLGKWWIIKPPASARGVGVKVIHKWSQVPKNRPIIVQRYLSDPYLINETKFDLRIYVLLPSIEPLRIYVFDDGLVRFASEKYSLSNKTFNNKFMHLTNYSINRKSSSYTANDDGNSCQGHKWTLKSFWSYMSNCGIDTIKIKEDIVDMVIKTILCSESPICRLLKTYAKSTYSCYELFGFDIMLDKDLRPWLIEVNISPSLHTRSLLDSSVKSKLVKDMLNIAGFQVFLNNIDSSTINTAKDFEIAMTTIHKHKSLRNRFLNQEEKEKHSYYTFQHSQDMSILDNLTTDDLLCLVESEDEFSRKGSFVRVFPCIHSAKYFRYFDHMRYYNLLLDAWEKRFYLDREKGISLLQNLWEKYLGSCKKNESPILSSEDKLTTDGNH